MSLKPPEKFPLPWRRGARVTMMYTWRRRLRMRFLLMALGAFAAGGGTQTIVALTLLIASVVLLAAAYLIGASL